MRVASHWYDNKTDLGAYLKLLHKEMAEAAQRNDSTRAQATAYNIIAVMREIEREKFERETHSIQFKLRDIITHATEGDMKPKEALEKIRKLL